ncbi:hypothetical protein [Streptomyces sp. NPDC017890]|uniref:hypothetical protein n=1 Tax=Streptomyces sp. NPDC017890 TaxID=3365015 RepID=UPI0037B3D4B9
MAVHTIVIEDLHSPPGSPKQIFLVLTDPWLPFTTKTWAIATPNNWVGVGGGEFRIVGWDSRTVELRDVPWQNVATRVQLRMKYPDDCVPNPDGTFKSGTGIYTRPQSEPGTLKWIGRNILPDHF